MEVLLLTTLFSILFAVLFLTLFLRDRQVKGFGGVEREALMPLDDRDDVALVTAVPGTPSVSAEEGSNHKFCGCGGHHDTDENRTCQGCRGEKPARNLK